MSPEDRKTQTENRLWNEGIPFLPSLPCIESEEDVRLRTAAEVGVRMVCLFCVAGSAFELGDSTFKNYLREYELWEHLTPDEVSFLSAEVPDLEKVMSFTWRSEAIFVLMWADRLVASLPLPRQETDTGEIVSRLPGVDQSPWPFIESLRLRTTAEILDASDLIYRLHWAVRDASLHGRPPPAGLNPGVVQEWHHAINWLTRYDDQHWDNVATDT